MAMLNNQRVCSIISPSLNMIKHDQPEHEPHLPYLAIFFTGASHETRRTAAWIPGRFRKKSESNGACASDCRAAFKKHLGRVELAELSETNWNEENTKMDV